MLTKDEIERRKDRIRKDPDTARLCAKLGVTVEQFLANIEHSPQAKLHDNVEPGREKERIASIASIARRVFGELRHRRDQASHRFDAVSGASALNQENDTRRLLGAQE